MKNLILIASLSTSLLAACSDDDVTGTITATAYGEEFIEVGIPADEMVDGWALTFDSFVVSIGNVKAQAGHDNPEVGFDEFFTIDLATSSGGEGHVMAEFDAPGGAYDHYGYQINSMAVAGTATKAGVTKTFAWDFTSRLTYAHCEAGITVDGDNKTMQSTIHADHLLYDDAVSDEPNVAFDLIASADANADGVITEAELAATDIRGETRYQVGSLKDPNGDAITNLWQYISHQSTSVGHINGEGHCEDVIVVPAP